MDIAKTLELTKPPIQVMRTTVFFSAKPAIPVVGAGRIHALWAADFPDVEEFPSQPPLPLPKNDIDSDEISESLMPFLTFKGPEKSVLFQSDRLALTWEVNEEENSYPSFAILGTEMIDKFEVLKDFCRENYSVEMTPVACEVRYIDLLPGIGFKDYVKCLLDEFKTEPNREDITELSARYSDHWHDKDSTDLVAWRVITQDTESGVDLDISVRNAIDDSDIQTAITKAHDLALEAFRSSVSPAMLKEWGVK